MNTTESSPVDSHDKLLSVSVAAYNVEDYLEKALDSCLVNGSEMLEVIIVDDGSCDRTADIAARYAEMRPDVFRLIKKENAGYGSTVNVALACARGKYFRLLDGDDWFDGDGLMQLLSDLREHDCDLAITPYVEVYETSECKVDQANPKAIGLCRFTEGLVPRELSMHSATFRTSLLRQVDLTLPERRLYTDCLFVSAPLSVVSSVFVSHKPLYQYRLSREGQSVAFESQVRNRKDKLLLIDDLIELYGKASGNAPAQTIIGYWISGTCGYILQLLYSLEPNNSNKVEVRKFIGHMREHSEIYEMCRRQSRWFRGLTTFNRFGYSPTSKIVRLFGQLA